MYFVDIWIHDLSMSHIGSELLYLTSRTLSFSVYFNVALSKPQTCQSCLVTSNKMLKYKDLQCRDIIFDAILMSCCMIAVAWFLKMLMIMTLLNKMFQHGCSFIGIYWSIFLVEYILSTHTLLANLSYPTVLHRFHCKRVPICALMRLYFVCYSCVEVTEEAISWQKVICSY